MRVRERYTACAGVAPRVRDTIPSSIERESIAGVYTRENLATSLSVGAFFFRASSTRVTIRERSVSFDLAVTSTSMYPSLLIVPARTSSPSDLGTGYDSPVREASFTEVCPLATIPSRPILSPGRTMMISPGSTFSTRTHASPWPVFTVTELGSISIKAWMSFLTWFPALSSRSCDMKKRNMTAAPSAGAPITIAPNEATVIKKCMSRSSLASPLRPFGTI